MFRINWCKILSVKQRKSKKKERPVYDAIRKPTAPASQRFGAERREDKLDPVQRKTKHKKKTIDPDADV